LMAKKIVSFGKTIFLLSIAKYLIRIGINTLSLAEIMVAIS